MFTGKPILFYDGSCGVCNGFVQWVLKNDKSKTITFCSLQSIQTVKLLSPYKEFEGLKTFNTIYFINESNSLLKRSKAIIGILQTMKFKLFLIQLLKVIPIFVLDIGYRVFANNRFLFKTSQCIIVSVDNKHRFI
jgi:predicted DCC family thiol-disulfide oxidoreductase YuxK